MKRFLLFSGCDHQATEQGWDGFRDDFDTIGDAMCATNELLSRGECDWFHIVDTDSRQKVECGYRKEEVWVTSFFTTTLPWDPGEG